jgi:hypothetical protein
MSKKTKTDSWENFMGNDNSVALFTDIKSTEQINLSGGASYDFSVGFDADSLDVTVTSTKDGQPGKSATGNLSGSGNVTAIGGNGGSAVNGGQGGAGGNVTVGF